MTAADGLKINADLVKESNLLRRDAAKQVGDSAQPAGLAEAILASTPDHVYLYDSGMRYLYASAAGARAIGVTAEMMVGKTWRELGFPPAIMEPLECQVRSVFSTGAVVSGETEFPIASGTGYYAYVLAPVRDDAGSVTAVVSSVRDVTKMFRLRRMLDNVGASVRAATDDAFFQVLVVQLTRTLGVRFAFIEEFEDAARTRLRGVAAAENGAIATGIAYDLAGSPCENVVTGTTCSYPSGVQELFPRDTLLVDMRAQAYVGTPLVDSSGRVLGLLAVLHDAPISDTDLVKTVIELFAVRASAELDRRNREVVLKRLQRLMLSAERVGLMGSFEWDIRTNRVQFSPGLYELFGIDPATALTFESAMSFVHAADVPHIEQQLSDAIAGRGRIGGSFRIQRADGTQRALSWTSELERDADGMPLMFVGTAHDATERADAERALRTSEERYRSLVDNASLGIYRSTQGGRLVSVNPALVAMLAYDSADDLLGAELARDIYCNATDRERIIGAGGRQGSLTPVEVEWRRKDGTRLSVRLRGSRIAQSDGDDDFIVTVEDVTAQHAMEGQLRQSQKMEGIGRMAGGIAHDFNNILTAITSYAELLLIGSASEAERRADVAEILSAANRAAALTRQLLAFSRQQVLEPRVLDLNTIVANMDQMLRRIIGEDITLVTALRATAHVRADPAQMEQVIMNLVVNARDAVRLGAQVAITTDDHIVSAEGRAGTNSIAPGSYVRLSIEDNGIGMDERTLAQAFDPFFTTKPAGTGTGLGLSTAHGVVKQSGGYVYATSTPGVGTSIDVYLPAVQETAEWPATAALERRKPVGKRTILLVEDDAGVRRAARIALQREGYLVIEVSDPLAVATIARESTHAIDLLLTDVVMPALSGREVCEQVRAIIPNLPVLYMSGYPGDVRTREHSLDPDAPFLPKPFTAESLAEAVGLALDGAP